MTPTPTEEDLRLAREWLKTALPIAARTGISGVEETLAAFRAEARREMLRWILASLKEYPNGGGDIEVMQEVERIYDERYEKWVEERERENDKALQQTVARVQIDVREEREACERIVEEEAANWPELGAAILFAVQRRLRERAK